MVAPMALLSVDSLATHRKESRPSSGLADTEGSGGPSEGNTLTRLVVEVYSVKQVGDMARLELGNHPSSEVAADEPLDGMPLA